MTAHVTPLKNYQKQGVRQIHRFGGRVLLADDMGLGKSLQSLYWVLRTRNTPLLVICPAHLKHNWEREITVHFGKRPTQIIEGRKSRPLRVAPTSIVIINYDLVPYWQDRLIGAGFRALIVDESQYCKNRSAKRTKAVRKIAKTCAHVLALSGTPIENQPSEAWTVLDMVTNGEFGNMAEFSRRYCKFRMTRFGLRYVGAKNLRELNRRLTETCMIRRRKSEVLAELPEKSRHVLPMPIDNRKEYERAQNDFLDWLYTKNKQAAYRASKAENVTKVGYLLRLVSELKLQNCVRWIHDQLGNDSNKMLYFCVHRAHAKAIHKAFPHSMLIYGGMNSRQRQECVDSFQHDKSCNLLIGQIVAAGTGLTLTKANIVAFGELAWVPAKHTQAEDRAHRIGQTRNVSIYYLVGHDTIEERLCRILQTKQEVYDEAIDGTKSKGTLNVLELLERELRHAKR